jgi:uncharacterized protein YjiS (DUF1127 family)
MVTITASWDASRQHSRWANAPKAVWDSLNSWRNRQRQRNQLQELDGHMLRDIGLTPADVEIECNKPFWRA